MASLALVFIHIQQALSPGVKAAREVKKISHRHMVARRLGSTVTLNLNYSTTLHVMNLF
jgi:hypothetical protein